MIGFLLLGLLCLAVCVIALIRLLTGSRMRVSQRVAEIDAYGFSSEPAFVPAGPATETQRTSELVNRLGALVARRFGRISEADLRSELMSAGMYAVSPRTLLGYRVLAAILLPVVVLLLGAGSLVAILLALACIPVGWMGPLVIVRRRARLRIDRIDRALPDLIDLLVVMVEAGLGFAGALRMAVDQSSGPLRDELRLTLQEQAMGLAMGDALTNMLHRAETPAMRSFVRAVVQGENLGVSTGQIMRNLADEMRKRRRKSAEERAQKAPVKMLFPLVFLIFPTLFIVLLLPAVFSLQDALK